ncbi:hypothetical protein SAMN05660971_02570 [Halomonas cupida]|uniref:Uncharacterized protein n=1 Tax=Halomonas cupida TaxID=44933 RepID=A0A1M7HBX7_9GAMM|nr:hypothetical protein SAMN05660971_02570 [Halomonas cupida]
MKRSSFHPEDTRIRLHPLRFPFSRCEKTGSKKGPAEPARIRRELKGLKNGSIDRLVSPLNHLPVARRPEAVSTPALPGTGSSIPGWRTILPRSLRRRSAASVNVQAMCTPAFIELGGGIRARASMLLSIPVRATTAGTVSSQPCVAHRAEQTLGQLENTQGSEVPSWPGR